MRLSAEVSSLWRTLQEEREGALAALAAFVLIAYLALRGGGYEVVVRSELGVAIWVAILAVSAIGIFPRNSLSRRGYLLVGLFVAYVVWTGLALVWTESAERTVLELSRVVILFGIFVFALLARGADTLRWIAGGVGSAVGVIALLALLSRFEPGWFPPNEVAEVLPSEVDRLNYPLTYWNGLATLVAMGTPLIIWVAADARAVLLRALAAAALPALALTVYYTISRGGVAEMAIAVAVLVAFHPRRLTLLAPLALGGLGTAILIIAAGARSELADGLTTSTAADQGVQMLAITIAVCLLAGALNFAVQTAIERERITLPRVGRHHARRAALGCVLVAVIAALAVGAPGKISNSWSEFKQPVTPGGGSARLNSVSGSGRYQWWESAVDANASDPILGIGPGTWEYWWARGDGGVVGFVRDAHSLYLENLGELGIVGFLVIVAMVGGILITAILRVLRLADDPDRRAPSAAVLAALTTFAAAAAVDWAWEMTVLPAAFFVLAAATIEIREPKIPSGASRRTQPLLRIGFAAVAILAGVIVAVPMLSTSAIDRSKSEVDAGNLPEALASARYAQDLQPYAASPRLQEALILQLGGELEQAAAQASQATSDEPTNWRNWLVLSKIEQAQGRDQEAAADYERARSLNPRSPLLASPTLPSSDAAG